jgi:dCTP deaminase
MSVIPKSEILTRLAKRISEPESLVITPLLRRKVTLSPDSDPDAIDVRLGNFFLLPQLPPEPFYHPSERSGQHSHFRVHVPFGSYLVVPAHQTVLGATLEFIKVPCDMAGQILTKSSIARTFMVIETAPWIHPLYRGCLTLEIANVSNTPLLLYPGRSIGQLIFFEMKAAGSQTAAGDKKLRGTYLSPVYPEAPLFDNPEEELQSLGIDGSEIRILLQSGITLEQLQRLKA